MSDKKPSSSGPDVPATAFLEFQMSNEELASAITTAYRRCGTANEEQRIFLEHLKALLAIERARAQSCTTDTSNTKADRTEAKPHE